MGSKTLNCKAQELSMGYNMVFPENDSYALEKIVYYTVIILNLLKIFVKSC